ncbi:MAG TPA: hypothetical protein PKB02_00770 [Anaerohalosphaeraceae bacterium]|nr:hypothetical protein [Anaerohalosphaeraceae bacterium]
MTRPWLCIMFVLSGLFLPLCLANPPALSVTTPPAELNLDPFYAKYLNCDGITVISSKAVSDQAFYRLKFLLDKMLENRPDVREALSKNGNRFIIIGHNEQVTDIPDYADMKPKAFWDERARGFGGRTTSVGEENLLSLPEDRYEDESIFIHELAHSIHFVLRRLEPDFQKTLDALYNKAMAKGLYKNDYASTDSGEYWAEAVQGFFDANRANNWNHNHVNTRKLLTEYDPDVVELVRTTFRITPANDWHYEPLVKLPRVIQTPDRFKERSALPKYIWCRGFSIFGTANVSDEAMLCVDHTIRNLFRYRHDILKAMINADVAVAVYADDEFPTSLSVQKTLNVEAFLEHKDGTELAKLPASLRLGIAQSEVYSNHNRLIGTMALTAYLYTGLRPVDPDFDSKEQKLQYEIGLQRMDVRFDQQVKTLYDAAISQDLWASTPAFQNRFAYFAEGMQAFYDAGKVADNKGRSINTRDQLTGYDPKLTDLIGSIFKHPERYDWRFTPCSTKQAAP